MRKCHTHKHAIFPSTSRWIDFSSRLYGPWRKKQAKKRYPKTKPLSHTMKCVRRKCRNFVFFFVQFKIQFKWIDDFGIAQNSRCVKWNMISAIKNTAPSVEWLIIIICRWSTWLLFSSFNYFFFSSLFYRFTNFKIFLLFVLQVRIKRQLAHDSCYPITGIESQLMVEFFFCFRSKFMNKFRANGRKHDFYDFWLVHRIAYEK